MTVVNGEKNMMEMEKMTIMIVKRKKITMVKAGKKDCDGEPAEVLKMSVRR